MANKKTDKIVALAKQKSEAKEKLVLAVIEAMQQADETVNFNSVHVKTGVSKAYLYNNERLREAISSLRDGKDTPKREAEAADTVVDALRMEIKRLRAQVKELQHDELWRVKYEKMVEARNFYREKCERLLGEHF